VVRVAGWGLFFWRERERETLSAAADDDDALLGWWMLMTGLTATRKASKAQAKAQARKGQAVGKRVQGNSGTGECVLLVCAFAFACAYGRECACAFCSDWGCGGMQCKNRVQKRQSPKVERLF